MGANKTNKLGWRYQYVGTLGPFQIISPDGHVAVVVHGVSGNPSRDYPLVAKITKLCERHKKETADEHIT